jgi:hypothetical protein
MASYTLLTLCANRVSGMIAFTQCNPSYLFEDGEAMREVKLWSFVGFRADLRALHEVLVGLISGEENITEQ